MAKPQRDSSKFTAAPPIVSAATVPTELDKPTDLQATPANVALDPIESMKVLAPPEPPPPPDPNAPPPPGSVALGLTPPPFEAKGLPVQANPQKNWRPGGPARPAMAQGVRGARPAARPAAAALREMYDSGELVNRWYVTEDTPKRVSLMRGGYTMLQPGQQVSRQSHGGMDAIKGFAAQGIKLEPVEEV